MLYVDDHMLTFTTILVPNNKIPMVIFNDADLDSACECAIEAIWGYRGNVSNIYVQIIFVIGIIIGN